MISVLGFLILCFIFSICCLEYILEGVLITQQHRQIVNFLLGRLRNIRCTNNAYSSKVWLIGYTSFEKQSIFMCGLL